MSKAGEKKKILLKSLKKSAKQQYSNMKQTKMLVFPNDKIDRIIGLTGLIVEKNILKYRGKTVKCGGCGTIIKKEHLGSAMAHSEHFFCDNPACFSTFVRKFQMKSD